MKNAYLILTRSISLTANIWQRIQSGKRAKMQRMAYQRYAVFMSKELTSVKNLNQ